MFKLYNPIKTVDLNGYTVHSHDCPVCHTSTSVLITPEKLYAYNQGAYAQEVLSEYDPAVVERFITGICGECWSSMFTEEEQEQLHWNSTYATEKGVTNVTNN